VPIPFREAEVEHAPMPTPMRLLVGLAIEGELYSVNRAAGNVKTVIGTFVGA